MLELVRCAADGGADAVARLYEANRGLIYRIVSGYASMCATDIAVGIDDLMQVAYFAVVEAARTWCTERGGWANWLVLHVRTECNRALGRQNGRFLRPDRGAVSLDAPVSDDDDGSASVIDLMADETLPGADDALIDSELVQGVRSAVGRLSEGYQQQVIEQCELCGRSSQAVADDLGLTVGVVQGELRRALRTLRRDRELIELKKAHCVCPPSAYQYKGVRSFQADWTSTTENAALWGL